MSDPRNQAWAEHQHLQGKSLSHLSFGMEGGKEVKSSFGKEAAQAAPFWDGTAAPRAILQAETGQGTTALNWQRIKCQEEIITQW